MMHLLREGLCFVILKTTTDQYPTNATLKTHHTEWSWAISDVLFHAYKRSHLV